MKEVSKTCAPTTSKASHNATGSPALEHGHTPCGGQDGPMIAPYGRRHALAKVSARQAKEAGLMMSGTYGPPCSTSSTSAGLSTLLANRLRASSDLSGSILYRLTWKVRVMGMRIVHKGPGEGWRILSLLRAGPPQKLRTTRAGLRNLRWERPNTAVTSKTSPNSRDGRLHAGKTVPRGGRDRERTGFQDRWHSRVGRRRTRWTPNSEHAREKARSSFATKLSRRAGQHRHIGTTGAPMLFLGTSGEAAAKANNCPTRRFISRDGRRQRQATGTGENDHTRKRQ